MPQLLAHERQPHELLVLVAVADDEMVGGLVEAEHCLELRLAAALEADAVGGAELDDLVDHVALLVHLNRVDSRIGPLVAELLDRVVELGSEGLDAGAQDIGEAKQQRQTDTLGMEIHGQVVQIQSAFPIGVGMNGDVTFAVHPEVAEPPSGHVVQLLSVPGGPARGSDGRGYGRAPGGRRMGNCNEVAGAMKALHHSSTDATGSRRPGRVQPFSRLGKVYGFWA
jgi:hypothetical protein